MNTERKRFWSGNKRFRLMLTLELAVMLPAAALIYVNFHHLESIKRDKNVEVTIHRELVLEVEDLASRGCGDEECGHQLSQ